MIIRKKKTLKGGSGSPLSSPNMGLAAAPAPGMGLGGGAQEAPEKEEDDEMSSAIGSMALNFLGIPEVLHHAIEGLETAEKLKFGGFENALGAQAGEAAVAAAKAFVKNPNPAQQINPALAFMPAPKLGLSAWRANRTGLALASTTSTTRSNPRDDGDDSGRRKKVLGR